MSIVKTLRDTFGPGFLFAAAAVGTSHLVQSTRAGADYGFSLIWLVVLACLIKYPVFRFGSEYAAATGNTLIDNYARQGRWAILLYAATLPVDMFIATAAVSLVSAGIVKHVFMLDIGITSITASLLIAAAALLFSGKYRIFENLTKCIVLLFTVLVLIASVMSLPRLDWDGTMLAPLSMDRPDSLFYIALAGWMPTAITASVFQSIWVCEKSRTLGRPVTLDETRFDFNVGYFSSLVLALCFVLLGAALLFKSAVSVAAGASGFAAQLIDMFTQAIGGWVYPLIALATLCVMLSTIFALLDACPRAAGMVIQQLHNKDGRQAARQYYPALLIIQVSGAIAFLLLFLESFKAFIDLATSVAFLTAPVIAFFNHRAIFHSDVPAAAQPAAVMKWWSVGGIVLLLGFALWFISLKL